MEKNKLIKTEKVEIVDYTVIKMKKWRVYAFLLVVLLLATLFINIKYVKSVEPGIESGYIFIAGNGIYWSITSSEPKLSFENILNPNYIVNYNIKEIEIEFEIINNWREIYNYFIAGLFYDNTNLTCINLDKATLRIYYSDVLDLPSANNIAYNLSMAFKLRLTLANYDEKHIEYYSPLNSSVIKNILAKAINWNLTGIFSLIYFDKLFEEDYLQIKIGITPVNNKIIRYSSQISSLKYSSLPASGDFKLSTIFPNINDATTRRDIRNTTIRIHLKNTYLIDVSHGVTVSFNSFSNMYTIKASYGPGEKFEDISIRFLYQYPFLYVDKGVKLTDGNVTVNINVKNIGVVDAYNVTIIEPDWWSQYNLKPLNNETSWNIRKIPAGGEITCSYKIIKVKIPKFIEIYPTYVHIRTYGQIITYTSSSINIHNLSNRISIISSFIRDISNLRPTVGETVTYYLGIKNRGNLTIYNITVDNIFIPYLITDSMWDRRFTIHLSSMEKTIFSLNHTINYQVDGDIYTLLSPMLSLLYMPETSLIPYISVSIKLSEEGNLLYNLTINIKNSGAYNITRLYITSILFDNTEYISGDFLLINQTLTYRHDKVVYPGDSIKIISKILLKEGTSSLSPLIYIVAENRYGTNLLIAKIYPIMDTIYYKIIYPPPILLKNVNYQLQIYIENLDLFPIYNVTFKITVEGAEYSNITSTSIKSLSPNSEHYAIYNLSAIHKGRCTIDNIMIKYMYGGKIFIITFKNHTSSIISGIMVNIRYPKSISEGQMPLIQLLIRRDTELINKIYLKWELPSFILFKDGSAKIEKEYVFIDDMLSINLTLLIESPGKYQIPPPIITFRINDKIYSISDIGIKINDIIINVKENILLRYWIYFIPMLIIAVASSIFIKRKVGI